MLGAPRADKGDSRPWGRPGVADAARPSLAAGSEPAPVPTLAPKPAPKPWTRADWVVSIGLALATGLAHVPFRARHLSTWDSVLFALGMDRYSVPEGRPHP